MGFLKKAIAKKKKDHLRTQRDLKQGKRVNKKDLAQLLRWKTPKSEQWFRRRWKDIGMLDDQDLFNYPFAGFIPDVLNTRYRYVIEVDASLHELKAQKRLDEFKNQVYAAHGYAVFCVKAFDEKSLQLAARGIERGIKNVFPVS